jgi:hypothetical protein
MILRSNLKEFGAFTMVTLQVLLGGSAWVRYLCNRES